MRPEVESGCTQSTPNFKIKNWIAVVKEGQCTIHAKIKYAQQAGASALLVAGAGMEDDIERSEDEEVLVGQESGEDVVAVEGDLPEQQQFIHVTTSIIPSDAEIPCYLIDSRTYRALKTISQRNGHLQIRIHGPSSQDSKTATKLEAMFEKSTTVIYLLITALCTSYVVTGLARFLKTQWIQQQYLRNVKIKTYNEEHRERKITSAPTCAICLFEFSDGEKQNELPCMHQFHKDCFEELMVRNWTQCPLCKRSFVDAKGEALAKQERMIQDEWMINLPT